MKRISILLALSIVPLSQASALGAQDGLFGQVLKKATDEVDKRISERRAPRPNARRPDRAGPSSAPAGGGEMSAELGPFATARIGTVPRNLWLNVRHGAKFEPVQGKAQIIATNPYISPDTILFAAMQGMDCAPDGSVIVAARGWENGDVKSVGWWRIAPDGAVTPIANHAPWPVQAGVPLPNEFSVAPDGSLLTASRNAIYRVTGGRSERLAGENEKGGFADGQGSAALFKNPRYPVEDGQGNLWLSDQDDCVLRRISPGGEVSTVIGQDRSTCGDRSAGERIPVSSIVWDAANGELVAAGSVIVARPTHEMHVMVWRIRPDGQARRVYYTVKAGRSPIGQNMDHIWAVAVDKSGSIAVGTRTIGGNARRQMMRLDEKAGRLVPLTGQAFGNADIRPGGEEQPYDGPAARASFRESKRMCYAPDRTLFVLDEHLVRRVNTDGTVRTWAY